MDHAAHSSASATMAMDMSGTATAGAANATATKMAMGGMGNGCKISVSRNLACRRQILADISLPTDVVELEYSRRM